MNSTETVGLAGEYAVAFELCKRGFYAQLTLGNHKKTDILVETPQSLFRVSVKAKSKRQWPKVSGIWAKGDLLVFVDFFKKEVDELPDFYILDVPSWKKVTKKIVNTRNDGAKINKENTIYWEPWDGNPRGFIGCPINISDVKEYRDCWPASI